MHIADKLKRMGIDITEGRMPLHQGRSAKVRSSNIAEVLTAYKETGKIGNTKPSSMRHAKRIAAAIAYSKARKG
jgi:hypothetical protein